MRTIATKKMLQVERVNSCSHNFRKLSRTTANVSQLDNANRKLQRNKHPNTGLHRMRKGIACTEFWGCKGK